MAATSTLLVCLATNLIFLTIHSVRSHDRLVTVSADPLLCTVEESMSRDSNHMSSENDIVELAVDKSQARLYAVANFSLNRTVISTDGVFQFIQKGCNVLSPKCVAVLSIVTCPLVSAMDFWAGKHSVPHVVYPIDADNCGSLTPNSLQLSPHGQVHSQILRTLIQRIWGWREVVFIFDDFLEPETRLRISLMLSDISVTSCSVRINDQLANETLKNILKAVSDMRHVIVAVTSNMLSIIFQQAKRQGLLTRFYKWVVLSNTTCDEALNTSVLVDSNLLYLRSTHLDMTTSKHSCQFPLTPLEENVAARSHLISAGIEAVIGALAQEELLLEVGNEDVCDQQQAAKRLKAMQLAKKTAVETAEGQVTFDSLSGRVNSFGFEFCSSDNTNPSGYSSLGSWSPSSIETMKKDTNLFKNAFGDFRGKTLLIGGMEVSQKLFGQKDARPFILKTTRGNSTVFDGFCVSILQELAVRLNFSYKIVEPPDMLWGAPIGNGTWNGLIGMVMRGEINFVIGPLTITSSRAAVIDFTTPYMEDGTGILTKKPDPDSDTVSGFFRLFKAMKPMVWACLCGSVIGVSLIIYLVDRWSPFSERRSSKMDDTPVSSFFNSFWSALGSMLAQGSEYQPKSSSARVILGFWWLFTIILVSTYTANMTAVLTVTIREQPINSVTELAGQSQVKPLVKLGTNLYTLFEEAKDNIYQTIWKMMSGNEAKARTNQEALAFVKTGKYAFLTDRSQLEYIVKNDCLTYALAEDVFNTAGMGFVLPKNAEFLKSVDDIIMKLKESGIIDGWRRQWWAGGSKCSEADRVSTVSQLDLKYLAGPFIVFLAAMAASIVVVILEKCLTTRCSSTKLENQ